MKMLGIDRLHGIREGVMKWIKIGKYVVNPDSIVGLTEGGSESENPEVLLSGGHKIVVTKAQYDALADRLKIKAVDIDEEKGSKKAKPPAGGKPFDSDVDMTGSRGWS
jgi:hypothetical protein